MEERHWMNMMIESTTKQTAGVGAGKKSTRVDKRNEEVEPDREKSIYGKDADPSLWVVNSPNMENFLMKLWAENATYR